MLIKPTSPNTPASRHNTAAPSSIQFHVTRGLRFYARANPTSDYKNPCFLSHFISDLVSNQSSLGLQSQARSQVYKLFQAARQV